VLEQALHAARSFRPLSEAAVEALLGRTAHAARDGKYELYKTTHHFDGTYQIHNGWGETMRVGFIGLGAMGSRMASRLVAAHHDVVVYNRTPERARPLEQRGAKVAATPKQLAAGTDIVFSSVANDAALEQVMFGPMVPLAGARAGTIVVEMKHVNPRASRRLHEAARSKRRRGRSTLPFREHVQAEQGQS